VITVFADQLMYAQTWFTGRNRRHLYLQSDFTQFIGNCCASVIDRRRDGGVPGFAVPTRFQKSTSDPNKLVEAMTQSRNNDYTVARCPAG
jgi:hypothetical protein